MGKKLTNNLKLKILSVFLAFFVWLAVTNISNPDVTATKEVPLEVLNEDVLSTNGKSCRMEITVSSNGRQFRTEVDGNTMYYAIDDALPKLERQILKHKGKLTDKAGAAPEFGEFAFVTGVEEEKTPEIVKTKKFEIYAIDVKDAVEELEMVGHDFYVFVNRATDNVEIVYRRHDGKIGLLQPYVKE